MPQKALHTSFLSPMKAFKEKYCTYQDGRVEHFQRKLPVLGGKANRPKDCLWIYVYWVPLPGPSMKGLEMHQYMLSSNRAILGCKEYKLVGLVVHFPLEVCCRCLHQGTGTGSHTKSICSRSQKMSSFWDLEHPSETEKEFTFLNSCHCSSVFLNPVIVTKLTDFWLPHQVLCLWRNFLFKILLKVSVGDKAEDTRLQCKSEFDSERKSEFDSGCKDRHTPTLYFSQDCWPLDEMK